MIYINADYVRALTGGKLTVEKISDDNLNIIILQAVAEVNSEINVLVQEEEISYIDSWRKNQYSDGTTTMFYLLNGVTNYISDNDNDGDVTPSDLRVYKLDGNNMRTKLTVSSINVEDGSFVLSQPPGADTNKLTVTYSYTFYNVAKPDLIIKNLAGNLAASWGYLAVDHGISGSTKFGNISFSTPQASQSATLYYSQYQRLLGRARIPCLKPKMGISKYLI